MDGTNRIFTNGTIALQGNSSTVQVEAVNKLGQTFTGTILSVANENNTLPPSANSMVIQGDRLDTSLVVKSSGKVGIGGSPNDYANLDLRSKGRGFIADTMNTVKRNGINKQIATVTITNAGSGYTTGTPSVSAGASPCGGLDAYFSVTRSGSTVGSISILFPGSCYTTGGSLTFNNTGTGGTGATATYTVSSGTIPVGLMIYNTDSACYQSFNGSSWINMREGSGGGGGGGSGTVTSFGKVDGYGITSSVTNPTTTPVHTIAVDTATLFPAIRATLPPETYDSLKTKYPIVITSTGGLDSIGLSQSYQDSLVNNVTKINDSTIRVFKAGTSTDLLILGNASGGGARQALDLTLRTGNTTRQTYIVDDSSATSTGSLVNWEYRPSNFRTYYGVRGTQMSMKGGYVRYNGVNASGRPNVVYDIFSYNGGFNSPDSTNEAAFRHGFENHFETGGGNLFEYHTGEFKPRGSAISFRIGTYYMNKDNGQTTYSQQIQSYIKYFGGLTTLGDSINFSVTPTAALFGFRGAGSLTMIDQQVPTTTYTQTLVAGGGVNYTLGSATTPTTSYFTFASPAQFSTSATLGTTNQSAIQAAVGTANYAGLRIAQSGLSTSDFYGIFSASISTSGTYTALHGQNTNAAGMVRSLLIGQNGATAAYHLRDASVGIDWSIGKITSGDVNRSMKISFGTTTYDSLLKFNAAGTYAGQAKFRYSVAIGANEAVASAVLDLQSTTKGFLPPRMTATQASAISSPEEGLMIYVTNTNGTFTSKGWWGWSGAAWEKLNN